MIEEDIHKCILSYGFFTLTLILKELEEQDRYEECNTILKAMISYRERFKIIKEEIPTRWSEDFEKEYYSYFKKLDSNGELLARGNMEGYLLDIKKRLQL